MQLNNLMYILNDHSNKLTNTSTTVHIITLFSDSTT